MDDSLNFQEFHTEDVTPKTGDDPESIHIDHDTLQHLLDFFTTKLTPEEQQIISLRLDGKTYDEIGEIIGKSGPWVGNRLSKIYRKYKNS